MALQKPPRIVIGRIEDVPPAKADVVTARALAPLGQLLAWADRHRTDTAICLFHKGKGWQAELTEAMKDWDIPCQPLSSKTDRDAVILRIGSYTATAGVRDRQPERAASARPRRRLTSPRRWLPWANPVLLIDLDPQGNASTGLGVPRSERSPGSYEFLLGLAPLADCVRPSQIPGLSVMPASVSPRRCGDRAHRRRAARGTAWPTPSTRPAARRASAGPPS